MNILYNLVLVLNTTEDKVLMCYRSKDPYKGLYNLLGGKIEEGEDYIDSAYRELFEESGITIKDISLEPLIDFVWHPIHMEMKVFYGVLNKEVNVVDEVHKLYWIDINENFFDLNKFAGEGNIGHMIKLFQDWKER
jgi:8-oxo-dGTP diphosphatase